MRITLKVTNNIADSVVRYYSPFHNGWGRFYDEFNCHYDENNNSLIFNTEEDKAVVILKFS